MAKRPAHSTISILALMLALFFPIPALASSGAATEGEFELLEDEPSKHEKGKVILYEFADFYCPHCHMFERIVVTKLKEEFGDRLEARLIGFPVMPGKLPTAFEMYEQAVSMGKGPEMKKELFDSIHGKKIEVFDKTIRRLLLQKLSLDVDSFEEGLASGAPFRTLEEGKAWGERIKVTHTPTVVIDGNMRVANLTEENLRTIIRSILEQDKNS
ncbi:MAG: DsbA family protein [Nitrospirales bacterium]|nr:DsbA family protein [Nitrospira sp.]MDR4502409.1 DsbA family protein [Nitrospirales bacterium]